MKNKNEQYQIEREIYNSDLSDTDLRKAEEHVFLRDLAELVIASFLDMRKDPVKYRAFLETVRNRTAREERA